jgi:hypothetical protein
MPEIRVRSYAWLLHHRKPPHGTYIFTDRERMDQWELRVFGQLYNHLNSAGPGYRVLNHPARVMGRYQLLRKLYQEGINSFNAWLVSEGRMPDRYPVFIRRSFDHHQPLTDLLHNEKELQQALETLHVKQEPDEGLIIIEYCAEPASNDLFRKLAAFRIGDSILFFHTVHEKNWLVKYGSLNSATDELYQDEYEMIQNNKYKDELRRVFDIANVDYGRVDFGLVNGKIQIYEINTNPDIRPPGKKHPNPIRTKSVNLAFQKYAAALRAVDTPGSDSPYATKFHQPEWVLNRFDQFRFHTLIRRK